MPVSSTSRKAGPFIGNGVTTSFPFTFKVFAASDVAVYHTDAAGVQTKLTTGYTVTLNADQDTSPGGSITYPSAGSPLSASERLDLIGEQPYLQGVDIRNASTFQPSVIQRALDYLAILCQQLLEKANRALTAPPGDTADLTLPDAGERAGKFLGFDSSGNPVAAAAAGTDPSLRPDIDFFMRTIQPLKKYLPGSVDYDAIEAGTSTEDITTYLRNAFAGSNKIELPDGRINISDEIDLTGEFSIALVGVGSGRHTQTGNANVAGTRIVHLGTNKKGLRLTSISHLEGFAIEYLNQQAVTDTSSVAIELNGMIRHPVWRDLVAGRGNINIGLNQTTDPATMFDADWSHIASWQASHTHLDLRNNGGGTNSTFDNMYVNGAGQLDFSDFGQVCEYGIRGGNWTGYNWRGLSVDGLSFNQSIIAGQNMKTVFDDLRFESCRTTLNGGFWVDLGGGHTEFFARLFELFNCRSLSADGVNTTSIFRANPTLFTVVVEAARIAGGNVFTTATKRFFRAGGVSEDSAFHNRHFSDEDGIFTTPWSDDNSATRTVPPIRTFAGKVYSERTGNLAGGTTSHRIVYLQNNQAPGSATWAGAGGFGTKPWNAGDEIAVQDPGDYGRICRWRCIAAGTPGTWVPVEFAGGVAPLNFPGDADFTFTPLSSRGSIYYGTALTANRTVTLSTANAWNGLRIRVSRPAAGAFTLDVGGLKSLAAGEWCEVEYDGTAYRLVAFGSL